MDMLAFGMKMDEQALEPGTDEIRGKYNTLYTVMGKAEKIVEQKANEKHEADEEQKGDDHAEDKQVVVPVSTTQKERPSLLQSTSNHSVSSNFQEPFHAVKVCITPKATQVPPTTQPTPPQPAIEIPSTQVSNSEVTVILALSIKSQVPSLVRISDQVPSQCISEGLSVHILKHIKRNFLRRGQQDVIEELFKHNVINEVKTLSCQSFYHSSKGSTGKKTKKRRFNESESSKKASIAKESSKGKSLAKTSKSGKSMTTEEPVEEPIFYKALDDVEQTFDER
ncbi:hypothetical protein Tco_0427345 [Tanacetum coccineum]